MATRFHAVNVVAPIGGQHGLEDAFRTNLLRIAKRIHHLCMSRTMAAPGNEVVGWWDVADWAVGSWLICWGSPSHRQSECHGKNIRRKSMHAFDFTSYFSRVNRHFFVAASSPMRAVSPRLTACGLATLLGFDPSLRVPCHSCCSISTTTLGLGPEPSPTSGLVLPAALFSDLLQQRTVTAEAFQGVPMQNFDGNSRSKVINGLVRTIDEIFTQARLS